MSRTEQPVTPAEIPIACTLTDAAARRRQLAAIHAVMRAADAVADLPDGYAVRFPGDAEIAARLLQVITAERQCCAFLTFELRFEPAAGPIWLHLRGPDGTRPFLREWLPEPIADGEPPEA